MTNNSVLSKVDAPEYAGIWRLWKLASLGLFAAFVVVFADVARTLRRIESAKGFDNRCR